MRLLVLGAVFVAGVVGLTLAFPAVPADYNPHMAAVTELNRIKPLQNPKYETMADILGRRMLDRKSKVVGAIQDVVLNGNGNIAFLDVKFDRMQLSRPVFVNYAGMNVRTVTDGYKLSFNSDEIEGIYPTMLADIETAAGDDDVHSLKKLKGMSVQTISGRDIGTIDDVLFASNGERAEAVYVTLSLGTLRGKGVAIPFREVDFANSAIMRQVKITEDMANAMIGAAKE